MHKLNWLKMKKTFGLSKLMMKNGGDDDALVTKEGRVERGTKGGRDYFSIGWLEIKEAFGVDNTR